MKNKVFCHGILKNNNEVLILKRSFWDLYPNQWDLPGGFKKSDETDLRDKLQVACDCPEKVAKYKEQAADYICEKYNWDEVVDKTLEIYRK